MKMIRLNATTIRNVGLSIVAATALLVGCAKDPVINEPIDPSLANIVFSVPTGWPSPVYNFEGNALTVNGFKLGRRLFFERRLSRDNTISCGSCHQPFAAFAQLDHDLSHGVKDRLGTRNSPPMFNLNWHNSFFWDGGVNHIEIQPLSPITNPVEMDETMEGVMVKLREDQSYRDMFRDAFGDDSITTPRLLKALTQFMGMLVSANAKYDKYMRGEVELTVAEQRGLNVFKSKCSGCHTEPLFTDLSFRNNGLKLVLNSQGVIDSGRGRIPPFDDSNLYKFKVPSLRNLKYTAPYMHDGRFVSLNQVLDHYTSGIEHTPNLDLSLRDGIPLNAEERADLLQFLATLNDEEFVKDIRFREVP
jgi:cytochrome c peroxidase